MTDTALRISPASGAFASRIEHTDPSAARAADVGTLMLNVTLRCDLACGRCHQSASPQRTEEMSRATMLDALRLAKIVRPALIDVTGGEPSLWPLLPELVERARTEGHRVRVRTNLVALVRAECAHVPALFAEAGVEILGSLPQLDSADSASHRPLTSDAAVEVLRMLAGLGYGVPGGGLVLDLARNPAVGQLPRNEDALASELRQALGPLGVRFGSVLEIANVPVGRLGRTLEADGGLKAEIDRLADAFNPAVLGELACRHGIDVAWDGSLYDCDFNMGAGLRAIDGPRSVADALALADAGGDVVSALSSRRIALGEHCFACTAGAGSG